MRVDHQRARRVEDRHSAIINDHNVFTLAVNRNNLVVDRVTFRFVAKVGPGCSVARFHRVSLRRLDEHHTFRRHVGTLQIQHAPLANIPNLARFAVRVLKHSFDELSLGQRCPLLRVVVESGLNRIGDRFIELRRCYIAYPKRILGCLARVEWVTALARGGLCHA